MEKLVMEKRSSLFFQNVSDEEKSFKRLAERISLTLASIEQ
jgi:hypothetical protein